MTNAQAALMAAAAMFTGGAYSSADLVLERAAEFKEWLDGQDATPDPWRAQ